MKTILEERVFTFYSDMLDMRDNLEVSLKRFGIKSLIEFNIVNPLHYSYNVKFSVASDGGKFVNFAGLYVNTESGYVCLGYNANNNSYIPIFSVVDVFNSVSVVNGLEQRFNLGDVLYIIENFKINYMDFNVLNTMIDIESERSETVYKSVAINFLQQIRSSKNKQGSLQVMEDRDFYNYITIVFGEIIQKIDSLGREFFGNYILESKDIISFEDKTGEGSMERLYLYHIGNGIDPDFLRELSSCGVGRNRRVTLGSAQRKYGLLEVFSDDPKKGVAVASSWSYYDQYDITSIKSVSEDKTRSYNLTDLIKTMGRDLDLFFTLEIYDENPKFFEFFMDKLGLLREVDSIGRSRFVWRAKQYFKVIGSIEMGGAYSRKVKEVQLNYSSVASKSILNAGKIFEKIGKRILKNVSK